ncbi:Right handed beta helix region [Modestobacter sp. DSM 44400]|uniref:right-handed parallel beta-helix repeat-containing protein n=1 Tax=Modestobacter sp. DSM 44400 TaxID=1550230 RepID=UPI0008962BDA|nr:right-handed parallel beta-helix repeat-containing protein [Modestobacter sp. DSM 44400]SDY79708.1 Right handed beta helix region [Modestobacter sp. DSM 44400]
MKTPLALLFAALTFLGVCSVTVVSAALARAASDSASLVPTFSSVGVYWNPAGGGSGTAAEVSYRPHGSASWQDGTDLWFDGRGLGGRPAEYRGSIVGLASGTAYEVRLKLAGTSESVTKEVRTWSEDFPIATVVELPAKSTKPVDLRKTGSPTGYVLITGPDGGPATIDLQGQYDYGVRLTDSAYVIVRGLTIKGAKHHGIQLGTSTSDDVHDVVVEGNTISGWGVKDASGFGTPMDSAIYSNTSKLTRVVVQGNRLTSPNTTANSWSQSHNGSRHPAGPQGITFLRGAGNNVIRYNDIVGDATHHFNDGMGATANFGTSGFPGKDSDVHGNYIAYTWDDGIEAEGGGMNVRLYDNYLTEVYHGFGMAAVSLGPLYAYRNVQDVSRSDADATYGQAMFKMGGNTSGSTYYGDGRTYLFHNTALKPIDGPRNRKAIEAGDGRVLRNAVTRNNILGTGARLSRVP